MQSKKLSRMVLLMLILILFSTIMAFWAISSNGDAKKVKELEESNKTLSEQVEAIKVKTDEWDRIINGTTEVIMDTDEVTEVPVEEGTEEVIEEQPAVTPTPAPEEPVVEEQEKKTMTVQATNLNLRAKPSSGGTVVRKLPNAEGVTLTGNEQQAEGYLWLEVTDTKGNTGWVAKDFLR